MSRRVVKNYQISMGLPFEVRIQRSFDTIEVINDEQQLKKENNYQCEDNQLSAQQECEAIIENAKKEAELIIMKATQQSLETIESAKRDKVAIEETARMLGYEEGIESARRQYEDIIKEAESIREHALKQYEKVLSNAECDAVNIILDIAKKTIANELSINKENLLHIIRQAFSKCANKEEAILRVSADDYDYLTENKDELLTTIGDIGELEIKKDCTLKIGSCIVETSYGSVDAGVHTKLAKIEKEFMNFADSAVIEE